MCDDGCAENLAALSTWIIAFTSTSARETSFRAPVAIADRQILVMCDQLVDLNRLTAPVGFLTIEEMQRVGEALALFLDLYSTDTGVPDGGAHRSRL